MEIEIEPYWALKPDHSLIAKTDEENIAKFRRLFVSIIRHQLMSEVPLGTALSGGLDSSAIVAYMSKYKDNLKTFSVGFKEEENSELKEAKFLSDWIGTDHHELMLNYDVVKSLPKIIISFIQKKR